MDPECGRGSRVLTAVSGGGMEAALNSGGPDSGDRGQTLGEAPPAGITAESKICDKEVPDPQETLRL